MNINWNDPNFQGFAGARRRAARPKKVRKSIGSPLGRTLINLAVTCLLYTSTVIIVDMRLAEFVKYVIIYKTATKFWKETAEENKL